MNIIKKVAASLKVAINKSKTFCNIAEGTHAGSITMTAGEDIDSSGLIMSIDGNGDVILAGANDKPIGISADEATKGDPIALLLAGCAESTFMCVASGDINIGDSVYTSAGGKVSAVAGNGARKVGLAICSASSGCKVEVDPRGFGEQAWQVYACGTYAWAGSDANETMPCAGVLESDIVFASLQNSAGSETLVKAYAEEDALNFTLNGAGSASTTKIAWLIIRKN